MRTLPLLALLAATACGDPMNTPDDATVEDNDMAVDAAMVQDQIPQGQRLVGEPIRGSVGDDPESIYFVTQSNNGRLTAHRLHEGHVTNTQIAPDRTTEVKSVRIEPGADGSNELVVVAVCEADDGTTFEQDLAMTSKDDSFHPMPRERKGPARTWRSQQLDEVLAMAVTCSGRGGPYADGEINSDPLSNIEGAKLTPGPGAAFTVELPATEGDHAAPMATVQVDPAASTCDGTWTDRDIVTLTPNWTARQTLSDARECAAQVTEGTDYAAAQPVLEFDRKDQWIAWFNDGGLGVKMAYDGTEVTECTKLEG